MSARVRPWNRVCLVGMISGTNVPETIQGCMMTNIILWQNQTTTRYVMRKGRRLYGPELQRATT